MIKSYFKSTPYNFESTDRYKSYEYDEYSSIINELVYTFGRVYLFIGISDEFDDSYYMLVDSNGVINYHSMVGYIGESLKDFMSKSGYKKFKDYFLKSLEYQRDWRKQFDSDIYVSTPNAYTKVDYYLTEKGVPVVRKRITNLDQYVSENVNELDKKTIRSKFWLSFWHMFGFHHITNIRTIYDEVEYDRELEDTIPDFTNINEIHVGQCRLCNRIIKVKHSSKFVNFCDKHTWCRKLFKPLYRFCYFYRREIKD